MKKRAQGQSLALVLLKKVSLLTIRGIPDKREERMELHQTAYILNQRVYLYIMDFEDTYDYTFYSDNYLVMSTGRIPKAGHSLQEAMPIICASQYLKPEDIYRLSDEELQELINHVDDYNHINIL